ncbi:MAG: DNA polymerase/3'-5' exonuclease PolX [Chloroflexi bacterium]|nr:DNA polymerase/3'-5' exonuclease PolX [Chloroflexota bacterium]
MTEGSTVKNSEIAEVFENIAGLLELKGEIPFKIRAYQKAARTIEHHPVELSKLVEESGTEALREIPGIGEAISKKILELLDTGKLKYYEELKSEFPEGIIRLMDVPGIGPKTAMRASKELGINTVEELEKAILDGRLASLPRMGEKTAENILRHIRTMKTKDQRIPLGQVLPVVDDIIAELRQRTDIRSIEPAGSLRRFRETIGDIDLMGTSDDPEGTIRAFTQLPQVVDVLVMGPKKASVVLRDGLQVDLRIVEDDAYGALIQYFTGSKQHNVVLREWARRRGLSLSEYGITNLSTGEVERFATEEEFYKRLGLQLIPPEIREGGVEVELAEKGAIPRFVEVKDIRGDLHVHTKESDGQNSLEEMAVAARDRGYEYIAITEHSPGLGIARGLSEERLRSQIAKIEELNRKLKSIRILVGTEVDIRADGSLDYPDELLGELDVVVAAVHSSMNQERAKITARVIKAMSNPHVDILAHPSCRLIGEREPVDIDMEAVFKAALETHTAMEINGQPQRLDLKDIHIQRAKDLGVPLVVSTDAHSIAQLNLMRLGVATARRGWCEARHILNTRPLRELLEFCGRNG